MTRQERAQAKRERKAAQGSSGYAGRNTGPGADAERDRWERRKRAWAGHSGDGPEVDPAPVRDLRARRALTQAKHAIAFAKLRKPVPERRPQGGGR